MQHSLTESKSQFLMTMESIFPILAFLLRTLHFVNQRSEKASTSNDKWIVVPTKSSHYYDWYTFEIMWKYFSMLIAIFCAQCVQIKWWKKFSRTEKVLFSHMIRAIVAALVSAEQLFPAFTSSMIQQMGRVMNWHTVFSHLSLSLPSCRCAVEYRINVSWWLFVIA